MKKLTILKALVLSLMIAMCSVMPLHAQTDGFFRADSNEDYSDRANGYSLTNQDFGESAPVGSGLLIMVAAGAGYAIGRRRRSLRKASALLLACLMIFGLTQCKKNVETMSGNLDDAVYITLNVDNGSKHEVVPGELTAKVNYTEGDKIYVGNNGKYIGTLSYSSGAFSGTIYEPSTSDYLHFYFVGGLTPSKTLTPGETADFTVDICNQLRNLPVLSYVHSAENYDGSTTYTCKLENKCGLVKFVPSTSVDESAILCDVHNIAKIDFANPGITPTDDIGAIYLYNQSPTEKWAILLPQSEVINPTVGIYGYTSTITNIPAITNNMYYKTGVAIAMTPTDYKFTVNESDTKLSFSPGNLHATTNDLGNTWTWSFAPIQLDYIGAVGANNAITGWGTVSANGIVEFFGWSSQYQTSYGISNSTDGPDYYGTFRDWGTNAIGHHTASTWRTLTIDEWNYVLGNHTIGFSTVNGVMGCVLRPDGGSTESIPSAYTAKEWVAEQDCGAVFLPCTGFRVGSNVLYPGNSFIYRSSTLVTGSEGYRGADGIFVDIDGILKSGDVNTWYGYSVRLVR